MNDGTDRIESIILYQSTVEALEDEPPEVFRATITGLMQYGCTGIEPELSGTAKVVFLLTKPLIDNNNEKLLTMREQRKAAVNSRWKKYRDSKPNTGNTTVCDRIPRNTGYTSYCDCDTDSDSDSNTHSEPEESGVCDDSETPRKLFLSLWQTNADVFNCTARIESPKDFNRFWEDNKAITCDMVRLAVENFTADVREGVIERRYVPSFPDRFVLRGKILTFQERFRKKSDNSQAGPPKNLANKKSLGGLET